MGKACNWGLSLDYKSKATRYLLFLFLRLMILMVIGPIFPVRPQNRFISAWLEPVFSQTEKSCIESYYRQFSTNIKLKIKRLIPVLLAMPLATRDQQNELLMGH